MADPVGAPTKPQRSEAAEAAQAALVALLMKMLEGHAEASTITKERLKQAAANPTQKISQDLIDLIKELCDCKVIASIVDCLCKILGG